MNPKEIAKAACVPLPETCKALDWQGDTSLYWFEETLTRYKLVASEYGKGKYLYPAPNANDLLGVLAKIQEKKGIVHSAHLNTFGKYVVVLGDSFITNHEGNIAQALAELILSYQQFSEFIQ